MSTIVYVDPESTRKSETTPSKAPLTNQQEALITSTTPAGLETTLAEDSALISALLSLTDWKTCQNVLRFNLT